MSLVKRDLEQCLTRLRTFPSSVQARDRKILEGKVKAYQLKKSPQQQADHDELRALAYKYIGKTPPKCNKYFLYMIY